MSAVVDKGNAFLNRILLDAMVVQAGESVLEIGCGTGFRIGEMAKTLDREYIEGVDFSDAMVAIPSTSGRGTTAPSGRSQTCRSPAVLSPWRWKTSGNCDESRA
jgi:SAM-dependent methyltransferase